MISTNLIPVFRPAMSITGLHNSPLFKRVQIVDNILHMFVHTQNAQHICGQTSNLGKKAIARKLIFWFRKIRKKVDIISKCILPPALFICEAGLKNFTTTAMDG